MPERQEKRVTARRRPWIVGGLLTALLVLAFAPGVVAEHSGTNGKPSVEPGLTAYIPAPQISGLITIAGSDTMQPLLARLATEFRRFHPDTKFAVQGGGTEQAIDAVLQGIAASRRGDGNVKGHLGSNRPLLLAFSRPLTQSELGEFRTRFGYEPLELPIAMDAIAIYVHKDNLIQSLTLEQIDAIFGRDRRRGFKDDLSTWGQLGLQNGWERQPIHLYGRAKGSGTRGFFKHVALLDGELKATVKEEPGSASEILAIARDPLGIGYAGIGFNTSFVRTVPLAEIGKPPVMPSAESVGNGTYPLGRLLFLYVNKAPDAELKAAVTEFLKFINSRQGQEAVVKAGSYPLPITQIAKNLEILTGVSLAVASSPAASN